MSKAGKEEGSFEITSKGIVGDPLRNSDHRNKDFLELVCTNY